MAGVKQDIIMNDLNEKQVKLTDEIIQLSLSDKKKEMFKLIDKNDFSYLQENYEEFKMFEEDTKLGDRFDVSYDIYFYKKHLFNYLINRNKITQFGDIDDRHIF